MRKLVTIRTVSEINPIVDADNIVSAMVDGWQVVVKKDEFKVGDKAVFFEIDSFLPLHDERYSFLASKATTWEGKEGIRLRTIRLRKTLSQGLLLPLALFPEILNITEDEDIAAILGIEKWERPMPTQLVGHAKGNFPHFIRKTDQERAQNLTRELFDATFKNYHGDEIFEITMKLDGSSFTGYYLDGELGVCSRNLELKLDNESNSFVRTFYKTKLDKALTQLGKNIAVQGELCGEGIQGNREKFSSLQLFVFDIWLIDEQRYAKPTERMAILAELFAEDFDGSYVPTIAFKSEIPCNNMQDLLAFADGESINHRIREGLVYKSHDSDFTFKTISNIFLLGEK